MSKEDMIEFSGQVVELLPNAMFRVKLDNDHEILALQLRRQFGGRATEHGQPLGKRQPRQVTLVATLRLHAPSLCSVACPQAHVVRRAVV